MSLKQKMGLISSIFFVLTVVIGIFYFVNMSSINKININVEKSLINTNGNNINGGEIGVKDSYIYFINNVDGSSLYRMDLNGKNFTKVIDKVIDSFYILDEWIYMINFDSNEATGFNISKVKLDGSNFIKITDDIASEILVSNGWIYYSNTLDQGKIYKIDTNGGNKQKICAFRPLCMGIINNKIYFIERTTKDINNAGKLYRINNDGSSLEYLNIISTCRINIVNNIIYYGQRDGLYIGIIKSNNEIESKKICSIRPDEINLLHNNIYLTNIEGIDKANIYRASISGDEISIIYKGGWIDNLYVIGNYLFFKEGIKNPKMKVIKSDGTELQTFIKY